ncbi:MAG: hypothetical protein L6311_16550, partial [Cellulomonas sp.]|nr:hypothetical protein [Cellulomonas sp.]
APAAALSPTVTPAPRAVLHLARSWGDPGTLADLTAAWAGHPVSDLTAAWVGLTVGDLTALWGTPWTTPALPSQELVADLTVRSVKVDVRAATMTVTLTSDEAVAQDARINGTVLSTSPRARVVELLTAAGITVAPDDLASLPSEETLTAGWVFPTSSVWDVVQDVCNAAGVRIWCDEARRWHSATTAITTPGMTTLTGVTDLTTTDARDEGWADVLYMAYTGQVTDPDGNTDNRTFVWSQPDIPSSTALRAVAVTTDVGAVSSSNWPPDASYAEAQARYARLASLGTTIEVTAVADLTIRPGTLVATAAPLPVVSGIASTITWSLPADTVTITTRKAL